DRGSPAELVVEAEQEEGDDRHDRDRHVLAAEICRRALLDGAADLAHALVSGRLFEDPVGQADPEADRDSRAQQREQHGVMMEEPAQSASLTKFSAEGARRGAVSIKRAGLAVLLLAGAELRAVLAELLRLRLRDVNRVVAVAEGDL